MIHGRALAAAFLPLLAACEAGGPVAVPPPVTTVSACQRYGDAGAAIDFSRREPAIDGLLCWIERNSDYRFLPALLGWIDVTPQRMASLSQGSYASNAVAMYHCPTRSLHVRQGLEIASLPGQMMLAHELVHHAQCVHNGPQTSAAQRCAKEVEAYGLQARFMRSVMAGNATDEAVKARIVDAADRFEAHGGEACRRMGVAR